MPATISRSSAKTLLIFGTVLFLLGLINGALIQSFENPRMGLSAHLAGVQNALVLWAFGLMWSRVSLSKSMTAVAVWSAIYGMYSIWFGLVIAAVAGASRSLPIAGAGHSATAANELLVSALVLSGSAAIFAAGVLLLFGLYRGPDEKGVEPTA